MIALTNGRIDDFIETGVVVQIGRESDFVSAEGDLLLSEVESL